ncbi:MAG TPA: hypothetical protein VHM00_12220 [Caldimonas sp.]|jgi:uncharacterized lipoprotein YajG|nr:hypothetical protein [Caldimonas sp.]HEX2541833.1 hypothetical protein [Caldimonas sp.]
MIKILACSVLALCALAGCSAGPQQQGNTSPCATSPGGYDCQVERYQRAPG